MTQPKRFLSGIQPSGKLHLGNYFGAIAQHLALQHEGEAFYFIANYHALTTINNAAQLRALTREVAAAYLALGLDPQRAVLFRQSDVPELHELAWLLATVTGMGLLERAHAYKDKVARGIAPKVGLFYYPVLMAADILAYRSNVVPVGADQVQHVEMTRDMAGYFNHTYGEVFVLPEVRVSEVAGLVPGTDGQKMSKSYGNVIELFADDAALKKSVMGIVTDSAPVEAPKDPERNTIFQLYALVATPEEKAAMADAFRAGGYGYGEAKKALLAKLKTFFGPARERFAALLARPDDIEDVLREGARRARAEALATIEAARAACGLA
ncbi:tryptophan--tRNA ligase [Chloracidobacterium thermophilum]|uniref:Tryptophan--tRNA ligase n=1 Tax=Chloracidobacterium thermophilum (strain B) TaxID=981222 RepID=G2LGF8_CHLTF|nr:tryptophan--tRNA ligase [Chloracidobacterium thermophilum]AEP10918.1 tryptophanyl-tRNA synthetase [Chloracidobacterium thermophilum B]QUV78845.1 tryptophan--tRNA ligase [Chloracidobacterium thermophilum]